MKILVLGASGATGSLVVRQLILWLSYCWIKRSGKSGSLKCLWYIIN